MIKMHEIKQLSVDELKIRLNDMHEELENLRFHSAVQKLDNPSRIRYLRRDVARINTVLREYETGLRQVKKAESQVESA
jgi:large subunit ribosomal protein L29